MGEYAYYGRERVKIGTCEDLMYLRPDQATLVRKVESHDTDVLRHQSAFLFRFPFPSEDGVAPGRFDGPSRGFRIDLRLRDCEHGRVQFKDTRDNGYLVMLPCPEGPEAPDQQHKIQFNGYGGPTAITAQRVRDGKLCLVLTCKGCDHSWSFTELEDVQPVLDELLARAVEERRPGNRFGSETTASNLEKIHARIVEGYTNPPEWVR